MRNSNEKIQFWLNAEFSLFEQTNDPRKNLEPIGDLDVYCYKLPVAAYFSMTNSLRGINQPLKGMF